MSFANLSPLGRRLYRDRLYTTLNALSLALGLFVCLLIGLYGLHEWGVDRFHPEANRLFRVLVGTDFYGPKTLAVTSEKVGPALAHNYPELDGVVRLRPPQALPLKTGDQICKQEGVLYADAGFFDLFGFSLIRGQKTEVLQRPSTAVITRALARSLWGDADPLGRQLTVDGRRLEVTGLADDPPSDSHIQFSLLISMATLEPTLRYNDWTRFNMLTYVRLREGISVAALESKISDLSGLRETDGTPSQQYRLQPLRRIHLEPGLLWDPWTATDPKTLAQACLLGLAVLILAGINFINLSTAGALARAPGMGMRKILGARRGMLVGRFLLEALCSSALGMALALIALALLLPGLRNLVGVPLALRRLLRPDSLLLLAGLWLVTGLAAGAYPALLLTRFPPLAALRRGRGPLGSARLRQGLVVLQFGLTIAILAGTRVMGDQLRFMRRHDLGFDQARKLILPLPPDGLAQRDLLQIKAAFSDHALVQGAALSRGVPGTFMDYASGQRADDPDPSHRTRIYHLHVDRDFIPLYGLKRVAGTAAGPEQGVSPQQGVVVNEALVQALGWTQPDQAIGQALRTGHFDTPVPIVGVVRNFHFAGLKQEIGAVMLTYLPQWTRVLTLEVRPADLAALRPFLERVWRAQFPSQPMTYFFLDQHFNKSYGQEERLERAFQIFSLLGILIACLGLLGLTAHLTAHRTREVGIRKVLGASSGHVVWLLSWDFLRWVLMANVIAWPLAWWAASHWLEGFAFRMPLTPLPLVLAGGFSLCVAAVTASLLTFKTARANPAQSIRVE